VARNRTGTRGGE